MVSFFRKKKTSAEAKDPAVSANAQGAELPSNSSATVDQPAVTSTPTTTTRNIQKTAGGKRSSSFPTKKRNVLAGSLKGSRSSVSRLPAVKEENSPAAGQTPDTAPSSTPDLLGTLSVDNQEGQVEILTPSAKDEVRRQLKFDTPTRASRVASMEVTADGIVTQISQDEDPDILLDTSHEKESPAYGGATVSTGDTNQLTRDQSVESYNQNVVRTPPRIPKAATTTVPIKRPIGGPPPPPNPPSPMFVTSKREADDDAVVVQPKVPDTPQTQTPKKSGPIDVDAFVGVPGTPETTASAKEPEPSAPSPTPPSPEQAGPISVDRESPDLLNPLATIQPADQESIEVADANDVVEEEEETMEETAAETTAIADNTYNDSTTRNESTKPPGSPLQKMEKKLKEVASSFMSSFQFASSPAREEAKEETPPIQGSMSMFYDEMCKPVDLEQNPRRPFFDEEFAQRFVERMLTTGKSLLYLQPPGTTSNPSEDWKGRTVIMKIVPGSTGDQEAIQPRLQWTTMPGGTVSKAFMTSLSLLRIHSVLTAAQNLVPQDSTTADLDQDDLCFVSITSSSGKVFLFEANSVVERDEIANGLRNIIARLSFHLIAGDHQASTELYNDDRAIQEEVEPGDLPALANPKLNMNRMTHLLLEV